MNDTTAVLEQGRFALLGNAPVEHADDNSDLRSDEQQPEPEVVGYVNDKEQANAICRAGGFSRDGKWVYVNFWRDEHKPRSEGAIKKGNI
jgi:hypothetical protein